MSGPRPVSALEGVRPYALQPIGAPIDLKLDLNEGQSPPERVLDSLVHLDPERVRLYPSAVSLEARLAERVRVSADRVIVTNGGDDAIDRVCRATIEPGRNAVLTTPTFEMIGRSVALSGGKARQVEWIEGELPLDEMLGEVDDATGLIAVVTPNNPTGQVASLEALRSLSEAAPHAVLLVDLAYTEFADLDPTESLLSLPNAVIIRTLSKAWGLAGARVGYAIGPLEVIGWLRAAGGPFAVSGPSIEIALQAIEGEQPRSFIDQVKSERARLVELLQELGLRAAPSQGNFVLARSDRPRLVRDALAGLGVAVRYFGDKPGLTDAIRITCPGDQKAFDRLCPALLAAVRPEAVLFDLDGVIADVSRSYRQAIVKTAASYGVEVTAADIANAKAAGDANNDWVLTRDLLASKRVEADLDEVTERFERLYQGTESEPGLREQESMLVSRDELSMLAGRYRLGIVTGRPRADAERFLEQHEIAGLFEVTVCMEDAALKPDPAPVRLALARLGITSAWMIGDTPDDIRAARGAGVVPVGVPAPGERAESVRTSLTAAGAGIVIERTPELARILP
ncbi:MAG: TIGR01548 family HAD-type hydrolase [Planctomycetota bacterium]